MKLHLREKAGELFIDLTVSDLRHWFVRAQRLRLVRLESVTTGRIVGKQSVGKSRRFPLKHCCVLCGMLTTL